MSSESDISLDHSSDSLQPPRINLMQQGRCMAYVVPNPIPVANCDIDPPVTYKLLKLEVGETEPQKCDTLKTKWPKDFLIHFGHNKLSAKFF